MTPEAIMIFAAGHGTRMRELTQACPKPLLKVAGLPLIDRALALADEAGIARKVVNLHYLGEMIAAHLGGRGDIVFSPEAGAALETGGGLRHALPLLGAGPVFTLNPDSIWTGGNPLPALAAAWRGDAMSALLMLVPKARAIGHAGAGDFTLGADGRLQRFTGKGEPLIYGGAQIIATDGLADLPQGAFSLNLLWNRMLAEGRVFGILHPGRWADVGTPEGIALAEALLREAGDV
ncbi:MAG: nucleotidyltransferase family protein [Rhodobacteraceae bacterium]|nr:nucleotidyltransferase family protein [Paracoccaceae bacterium]